ncbi:MAG TPA: Gfo/Idh/MocA family oxidoreductase [Tepidisphaeraceae bacterium]|nr:Gfo/Idh/MocA family oxidoreductase [Tepidisphaeraceae bacterium]
MIGIGIIGLGVMGGQHIAAYTAAAAVGVGCRIVAVADERSERRAGQAATAGNVQSGGPSFDPAVVRAYESAAELLADPAVEVVSICTPTPTHVDLAIAALRAGKHVLVEKPVAMVTEQVRKLLEASQQSDRLIMPAMCMRFWPAWEWLKSAIDSRQFGRLRSLNLQRVGSLPGWSKWFADERMSGGAMIDLHIHDVDFIRHAVGRPAAVTSAGDAQHVSTIYHYDDPRVHITAQGAWLSPGTPFRMRFIADFEQATADFDIGRESQLLLCRDGKADAVDTGKLNGYDVEVRHFLAAVKALSAPGSGAGGSSRLRATLNDAVDVAIILETEAYAAEIGKRVAITWGVDEPPGH